MRSIYVKAIVQVFFDDEDIETKIQDNASGEDMTEREAIERIAIDRVNDFMPYSEDVIKVRDVVPDFSTLK